MNHTCLSGCVKPASRTACVGFIWLFAAAWLQAHDLWLKPRGNVLLGQAVTVEALSGMKFPESDHGPDTAQFVRRFLIDPAGQEQPLAPGPREPKAGLLHFTPTQAGIYVLAVETKPRLITLAADQFNEYLVSDGLPHIFLQRSKEGSLQQPGKERYSKSPKLILQVGQGGGGDPCRPLGLPLEIVPLKHPLALPVGSALPVRVLFRKEPLAEANLGWDHPGSEATPRGTVRTNAKGEALIPLDRAGWMTIRLTHMTRPRQADYEWESFWTTLTFQLPG